MRLYTIESIASQNRAQVLLLALLLTILIVGIDGFISPDVATGVLYTVPMTVAALVLSPMQILAVAVLMAVLREQFGPNPWSAETTARMSMGLIAFAATGMLVNQAARSQRRQAEALKKIHEEGNLRRRAEEELRAVVESSPAAILTVGADGRIETTNSAARRLLRLDAQTPGALEIGQYLPLLRDLVRSKRGLRLNGTMVEGHGRRSDGEAFYAEIWVSAYESGEQTKLTAVVADISEQLRDREELGLRQLLTNSRIIAAAVSHEIRNMAAAADAIHSTITQKYGLAGNQEFEALGGLIESMRKLATADVGSGTQEVLAGIDLGKFLEQLALVVSSSAEDPGLTFSWEIGDDLPRVRADRSGLFQVLLNLIQNSMRALSGKPDGRISITAYALGESVVIRVVDNGPGVTSPELLFQPFQPGASSSGLGLYVSRAIVRTYGGELRYVNRGAERGFLIEIPAETGEMATDA